MTRVHTPVLVEEVLRFLALKPTGVYVDCTLGTGGHALAIAARLTTGRLIGMDKDSMALRFAQERLGTLPNSLVHSSFVHLTDVLDRLGQGSVDGLLADLGVSTP
ncbi:MAG: 16S rRNA (cytosine(1402)-N(4))-methyltransferase, partial [Terriglobia bacterium]